jgi:hypothetical protein
MKRLLVPSSPEETQSKSGRRKALRKPSGLQFAIADSIHYLAAANWDEVCAGQSVFFERAYLHALETAAPDNMQMRYALVFDASGPVASVVMQIVDVSAMQFRALPKAAEKNGLRASLKKLLGNGKQKFKTGLQERLLVCGNLLSYGMHGVAFHREVEPADVWPAVAEVLYRVRRAEKLAGQTNFVLIKDIVGDIGPGLNQLTELSYRSVETEPNMVLALSPDWKSHKDYLASMASKYRSSANKQILEPIAEAGIELRNIDDVSRYASRIHELYLQVHENASVRPFTLSPGYWETLHAWGKQTDGTSRVCFTGMFKQNKMLGFIVNLKDGDDCVAYHIGFDREAANNQETPLPIYLRLLHASVEQAILMKGQRVLFGRTALEPKAALGAKPESMSIMLRHRQPVVNRLVRNLLGFVHHEEAPDRNPFKAIKNKEPAGEKAEA